MHTSIPDELFGVGGDSALNRHPCRRHPISIYFPLSPFLPPPPSFHIFSLHAPRQPVLTVLLNAHLDLPFEKLISVLSLSLSLSLFLSSTAGKTAPVSSTSTPGSEAEAPQDVAIRAACASSSSLSRQFSLARPLQSALLELPCDSLPGQFSSAGPDQVQFEMVPMQH